MRSRTLHLLLLLFTVLVLSVAAMAQYEEYMHLDPLPRPMTIPDNPQRTLAPPPDPVWDALHDPWFNLPPWGSASSQNAPATAQKELKNALVAWQKKALAPTEESLKKAVEEYPSYARAWNFLGHLYFADGHFAEARDAYERARKIDAGYALPYLGLIECASRAADWKQAAELSDQVQSLVHQESATVKADTLATNFPRAKEPASQSFLFFAQTERMRLEMISAVSYLQVGDFKKAALAALAASSMNPSSLSAALLLSDVLLKQGKTEEAKRVLASYAKGKAPKKERQQAEARLKSLDKA